MSTEIKVAIIGFLGLVIAAVITVILPTPDQKKLSARIIDKHTLTPIYQAEITFNGRNECSTTDKDGNFTIEIKNPSAKEVRMLISKEGYLAVDKKITLPYENETILMERTLPPPESKLDGTVFDGLTSKHLKGVFIIINVNRYDPVLKTDKSITDILSYDLVSDDKGKFFIPPFSDSVKDSDILNIRVEKKNYEPYDISIMIEVLKSNEDLLKIPLNPMKIEDINSTTEIQNCFYGAIEIGNKGVKPISIDGCDIDTKIIKKYKTRNVDFGEEEALENAGRAISSIFDEMQQDNIPKEHIYIVGSSSIANETHKDKIIEIVKQNTGKAMDFINSERETELELKYILSLLYPGIQEERLMQVLLIDIGSGNIKGCYYEKVDNVKVQKTFEIKSYGTKGFTKKVDAKRGSDRFKSVAGELREQELNEKISEKMRTEREFQSRKRVYLAGGIVWAMATLIRPGEWVIQDEITPDGEHIQDWKSFKVIKAEHIAKFHEIDIGHPLLDPEKYPNLDHIQSDTERKEWRKQVREVKKTFSQNELIGGAEILKALSDQLNFQNKTLFFAKEALYAWPIGYLQEKIEKERTIKEN